MKEMLVGAAALLAVNDVQCEELWSDVSESQTSLKFEKSLLETPIPVSVLTSEDFVTFNIQTMQEALSLLPGVVVSRDEYFDVSIGYHEVAPIHPRRMLVLIDNVPVMTSGLQRVSWWDLPIGLDDIERIELTRSPNAVLHGSNSFNGTIHIKTKRKTERRTASVVHYLDGYGTKTSGRFQDRFGDSVVSFALNKSDSTGYENARDDSTITSFSFSYDYIEGPLGIGFIYMASDGYRDGRANSFLSALPIAYQESGNASFDVSYIFDNGGVLGGSYQISNWKYDEQHSLTGPLVSASPALAELYRLDPDTANAIYFGGFQPSPDYEHFNLFLQVVDFAHATGFFRGEVYQFTNDLFLYEERETYQLNYRYQSSDFEYSFGYNLIDESTDTLVYLPSVGGNKEQAVEQYVVSGAYDFKWGSLSGSAMVESSELFGSHTQLRISALRKLTLNSSMRASVTRSHRLPSVWENFGGFGYELNAESNPYGFMGGMFFVQNVSQGNLRPEQNTYKELGYHYSSLNESIEVDVSLFHSDFDGLITELLKLESFAPSNNSDIDMYGIELSVSKRFRMHDFKVMVAILDSSIEAGSTFIDEEQFFSLEDGAFSPKFKASVVHSYKIGNSYNLTSQVDIINGSFEQNRQFYKLGISKALDVHGWMKVKLSGFIEHSTNEIMNHRGFLGSSKLGSDSRVSASVRVYF